MKKVHLILFFSCLFLTLSVSIHQLSKSSIPVLGPTPDVLKSAIVRSPANNAIPISSVRLSRSFISYPADISSGFIGTSQERPVDYPYDNIFHVELSVLPTSNEVVYLQYELFGVTDHTGVSRSINDAQAIGGQFVQLNKQWTRQKELINSNALHKGDNVIRFGLPLDAKHHYKIKDLSIIVEKRTNLQSYIAVNEPKQISYGTHAYLKGSVQLSAMEVSHKNETIKLFCNNKRVPVYNNEFEVILDSPADSSSTFTARLKAILPTGKTITKNVFFKETQTSFYTFKPFPKGIRNEGFTVKGQDLKVSMDNYNMLTAVEIPSSALQESKTISITALRDIDLPPLNPDLVNVTGGSPGFRFLPHGSRFATSAHLNLPFNSSLIPEGYTAADIRTYYFDEASRQWKVLPLDTTMVSAGIVSSLTTHFTDMINGIIKVPESPQTQGYVPTSIKDFKAADPSAGITFIDPPSANNTGNASLAFNFKLPRGRQGMEPVLGLHYNNEGGNSWLGLGWNLSLAAIGIETRWGIPRYDPALETETYTFNGEQLAPIARGAFVPRTADKQFYLRVEGNFNKIVRHGNNPSNYWWEVTDKNGTKNLYGGTPSVGVVNSAVLKDDDGNIGHWALVETRDLNDNFVRYQYEKVSHVGVSGGSVTGSQLYISRVSYSGSGVTDGPYIVEFVRDAQLGEQRRKDIEINCRLGFKMVSADLLRQIKISFNNQLIRRYELMYNEGAFNKQLLKSVSEFDDTGVLFYSHQFEYYDDINGTTGSEPLSKSENWNPKSDDIKGDITNSLPAFKGEGTILSSAKSKNSGRSLSLTLGIWDGSRSKSNTVGGNFGAGTGQTEGLATLVDINGDGLPDKVFKKSGQLFYRPNLGYATKEFGQLRPITGVSNFNYTNAETTTRGVEVNVWGGFWGRDNTHTTTTTKEYFSDFNGDGLIDIASNGQVFFNRIVGGNPVFLPGTTGTPSSITSGGNIDPQFLIPDTASQARLERDYPLQDVIRFWEAPFDGDISVSAPVQLMNVGTITSRLDGVRVSIQMGANVIWNTAISPNDFTVKSASFNRPIQKGQRIYFRVQSVYNGDNDVVKWDPIIKYNNTIAPAFDANGRPTNLYQASKDFIVTGSQLVPLHKEGTIKINGSFSKGITSDTVQLIISKKANGIETILVRNTYPSDVVTSTDVVTDAYQVMKDDSLRFIIKTDSYIDRAAIQWKPHLQYTAFADNTPVTNLNGKPTIESYVVADNSNYNDWIIKTPILANVQKDTISIQPFIRGSASANGPITFTVKGIDTMYGKRTFQLVNGNVNFGSDWINIIRRPNDTLFCEYHIAGHNVATDVAIQTAKFIIQKDTLYTDFNGNTNTVYRDTLQAGVYSNPSQDYLGSLFRGWGHFSFKGDITNGPLDETKINVNAFGNYTYSNPDFYADTSRFNQIQDVSLTDFVPLYANNQREAWVGFDSSVYVTGTTMGSARLWVHDVKVDSLMTGASLTASNRISETNTTSYASGFSAGGLSLNGSTSRTTTINRLDMMDMNGDRYPDVLHGNEIQFTLPGGGLEQNSKSHNLGEATFKGESKGISLGGSIPKASAKNTPSSNAQSASSNAASSIGISGSGNVSENNDEVVASWIDINGDGLPDKIYKDGNVALNLGYKFSARENWGVADIEKNETNQHGAGVSLGYNSLFGSFQGGYSVLGSNANSSTSFEDMNGDGLPDKVSISSGSLMVQLNTGNGFNSAKPWRGFNLINKNSSVGESVNSAFTTAIPIPLIFVILKFCINPSFSSGTGVSRDNEVIMDIDGDGFPDLLHSKDDGDLTVARSTVGRTNMLSKVQRPFGSSFTMDYERLGNTYDMPQSKWVLKNVEVFDGLKGDGVDTLRNAFTYSRGFYERHEREFYGFETVTTNQLNTSANNIVYRTRVRHFANRNYYARGQLESEWLQDASGNKYTQTNHLYQLRFVRDSVYFPAVVKTEKLYYEGHPTAGLTTYIQFDYDSLGNVIKIYDAGDSSQQDMLVANVTYHDNPTLHIKSIPAKIEVITAEGVKRKRTTVIDNQGNITRISQFLADGSSANTDMAYDSYGNLSKITRPVNYKGERMWYSYVYDDVVHTYTTKVSDAFGYNSTSTYDYRFGELTGTVSMNRERMIYKHDNRGRVTSITGPYELAAGKPYTIAFEYYPAAVVPYSITRHYDPEHNKDINTITFVDGLGRAVQVKKQAAIFKGKNLEDDLKMMVAGWTVYDALGRAVKSHYRTVEPIGPVNYNLSNTLGLLESTTGYDVLDRPVKTVLADGATSSTTYSITNGQFSTVSVDPLLNKKEMLTDVRGRNREAKEYGGPNGTISTKFQFNALSELLRVIDNNGNTTVNTYDNLGKQLSVLHPDAGLTEYTYDLAGNLIKKITAQIRKEIPNGGAIKYQYEYERLTDIDYPRQYQNKVKYIYGTASDTSHAGRVRLQQDASGGQEFFYGKLGEVTKVIRTMLESRVHATTYVSEQEYDTWNRIKKMTYPDGEVLTYHYNQAGGLKNIDGYKLGNSYKYVDQLGYDEYEQRVYLRYGNGTETQYTYDNLRRRLATLQATTAKGRKMMNNSYRYDAVSNILGITNNAEIETGKLGGYAKHDYRYDNLYRLDSASGTFKGYKDSASYGLKMGYDNLYNLVSKKMTGSKVDNSYEQLYKYTGTAPHQATQVGPDNYRYDLNGNNLGNGIYENFWDEENRLMAVINKGILNRYTYDASGERALKSSGGIQGIWVNGAPAGAINHDTNYTSYVSPYLVCRRTSFTKHYYIESQRVATKLGNGTFGNISFPQPALTAGGVDYTKRVDQIERSRAEYYASLGVSPGPPTDKNFYARPENSGIAAPVIVDTTRADVPVGWPGNTTPPTTGPPISIAPIPTNDTVRAGYGYKGQGLFYEKDQYFYHPDHLGSTSYVTDPFGEVNQHVEYSAFGETLFEEHTNSFNSPYLFNAKEKDVETGLYYYGARYYDPKLSQWLSVDPLEEEYPGLSPYNYCLNNPVIVIDPDGQMAKVIKVVAKTAIKSVMKGKLDLGEVYDLVDATATLVNPSASLADKGVALFDIVSPVSSKELKKGAEIASDLSKTKRGSNITENAAKGNKFESVSKADLNEKGHKDIADQVTIENSAGRTRIDHISTKDNKIHLREDKASAQAKLNPNQKRVHTAMEKEGGVIKGKKGGDKYPAGTRIPPTKVEVKRPIE